MVSLALLRRNPELSAVVADLPAVCDAGREIADATPEGPRLTHHPIDDFVRDELPGGFDAVLQCDVAIFTPALFAKIAGALRDGGRFLAVERWFDDGESMDARQIDYLFSESLRDPTFAFPTLEQIRRDLSEVGLELASVRELPRSGWKLLEARKVGNPAG